MCKQRFYCCEKRGGYVNLNNESKTLFIPLFAKSVMSKNNLFLHDPKAEEIVSKIDYDFNLLKQSKWLSMYMALRASMIWDLASPVPPISSITI